MASVPDRYQCGLTFGGAVWTCGCCCRRAQTTAWCATSSLYAYNAVANGIAVYRYLPTAPSTVD
jgi:hypothetical protein